MRWLRSVLNGGLCPWGSAPNPPGFTAVPARIAALLRNWGAAAPKPAGSCGGEADLPPPLLFRPLSRRSGCVPAQPYPPLRSFQSGRQQLRRATILRRMAMTPLTSYLTPGVHFTNAPSHTTTWLSRSAKLLISRPILDFLPARLFVHLVRGLFERLAHRRPGRCSHIPASRVLIQPKPITDYSEWSLVRLSAQMRVECA
jgi:hypothetical protein